MATRMQQRRGTEATWTSANPILAPGEIGFEIDTNRFKIGDGTNRWDNLVYFTADAAAALENLIDGAPGLLDTLNELASAINDDPTFFATVATNLSNHEADTTNVHGIANTADLATKSYADQAEADAISTASADATSKANAAQAAAEATASADATSKANAAQAAAEATASADATSKANAAQAAAEATAAAALSAAVSNLEDYADTAEADAKSYTDQKISDLIDGAPAALDTLNEIAASLGDDANYAATITNALALKAPLASPTFTGTVSGITKSMVGLGNVDNTSDVNKPVSTAQAAADTAVANAAASALASHESDTTNIHGIADTSLLATKSYADQAEADAIATAAADATSKANAAQAAAEATAAADATSKANAALASANTYTDGKVADLIDSAPGALDTLNELAAAIGDDENYASTITNALALKAPLVSPTFTGTVSGITKSMVGLGNVDDTSDANKPVSTATQSALDLKAPLASPTFTGTVVLPSDTSVGNVSSTEIGYLDGVTSAVQTQLNAKAPLASPTFTGTVSGITKSMVGLGNVDNTSDANKPISTDTQSALDLKAPLASPALTGVPTAPTAAAGTNTTQVATTAFVDAAIEALASRSLVLDGGGV